MHPNLLTQLNDRAYDLGRDAAGFLRIFSFDPQTGVVRKMLARKNLILYGGADIMAQCLTGNAVYAVDAMYLEFQNLADPSDPITPPVFDRSGGLAYYDGLSGSPDRDYLRIPLTVNPSIASSGSEYTGNRVTFFGISEGTTGVHGKAFDSSANSAVFGAALVATPDFEEQSQDVVFSRVYTGIDKVLKETGFEIGVTWTIQFS